MSSYFSLINFINLSKIGIKTLISEKRLPEKIEMIFLLFGKILDKSTFPFLSSSNKGWPTKVDFTFSLSKNFFSKLNNKRI